MQEKRAGRPPELPLQKMKKYAITLDKETIAAAKELGEGSASKGIRRKFDVCNKPKGAAISSHDSLAPSGKQ